MRYGPLNPYDINRLAEILDKNKVEYTVEPSPEHVAANDEKRREREAQGPRGRAASADGPLDYLFIEVPDTAIPLISFELEKMGLGFQSTGDELSGEDPEFDELVRKKQEPGNPTTRYLGLLVVCLVLAALYYWFHLTPPA